MTLSPRKQASFGLASSWQANCPRAPPANGTYPPHPAPHQHSPLPSSSFCCHFFLPTLPHKPPLGSPLLQSGFLPTHPPTDSVMALKCASGHTALFKTLHCDGPYDSVTPVPQLGDSRAKNQSSLCQVPTFSLWPLPHQVLASSPGEAQIEIPFLVSLPPHNLCSLTEVSGP